MVAKAIDIDTAMFKTTLLSAMNALFKMNGGVCSQDSDCRYSSCHGECDLSTRACTGRLTSSNLHVSIIIIHCLAKSEI